MADSSEGSSASSGPSEGHWRTGVAAAAIIAAVAIGVWLAQPARLFDTAGFPPRWQCGAWEQELGWLHVVSDLAIFGAYVSIPAVLLHFLRRRRDVPFSRLFALFGVFILACGFGHLLEAITFWAPVYRLSGVVKLLTAVVSWLTVLALVRVMPHALRLPGLASVNASLEREVAKWRAAEQRLEHINAELVTSQQAALRLADEREELRSLAESYLADSRTAEAMSSLVIEASASAQIVVDLDGKIDLFNAQAERIFGYTRDQVLGLPIEALVPLPLRAAHVAHRGAFAAAPSVREMGAGRELFGVRRDGTQVPVEIGLNPISTPRGRFVLASIIDITPRKQAERELRSYADALAASNRELEQFAQFASHDLQEPLRKLISFSALLVEDLAGELPETARKDLGFITDAATRMQSLVRGLLDLSRSGRREMRVQSVAMRACVDEAIEALAMRIEETGAVITIDGLPDVDGDRLLLTQLFQNLIGNALKFVRPGVRPELRITCAQQEGAVVYGVLDNGIGIKSEHVAQIFRPFRRLHSRSEYEGTGIGLAICCKAVERHGGRIWVESEVGKGSHFRFTLGSVTVGRDAPQVT